MEFIINYLIMRYLDWKGKKIIRQQHSAQIVTLSGIEKKNGLKTEQSAQQK